MKEGNFLLSWALSLVTGWELLNRAFGGSDKVANCPAEPPGAPSIKHAACSLKSLSRWHALTRCGSQDSSSREADLADPGTGLMTNLSTHSCAKVSAVPCAAVAQSGEVECGRLA